MRLLTDLTRAQLRTIGTTLGNKRFLIIVHPYYDGPNLRFDSFLKEKKFQGYVTIILDQHFTQQHIENKLALIPKEEKQSLFFVKAPFGKEATPATPKPAPENVSWARRRKIVSNSGWQDLIRRLQLMGAQKTQVLVDGRNVWHANARDLRSHMNSLKELGATGAIVDYNYDRLALSALRKTKKKAGPVWGCAGMTANKLRTTGLFKVRVTRKYN